MTSYVNKVKQLIQEERKSDQTIVLHSDEEIRSKYTSSIIAILNGEIIWNASIYPTQMRPLNTLILDGKKIRIGESWSVIIHPDFRGQWFGKKLTMTSLATFAHKYDIIVGATVNPKMFSLRIQQGFENIPFPRELYEEGKKYLAPFMTGWEAEFIQRAKCVMYNINLTEQQKKELIKILQKKT